LACPIGFGDEIHRSAFAGGVQRQRPAAHGRPPRGENSDGEWTHDIYARQITPASAAAMPNGRFMVAIHSCVYGAPRTAHVGFNRNVPLAIA